MADVVRRADARDRRPPGPVAGARRVPRPALGPDRGDVRRGPASSSRRWASRSSAASRAHDARPTGSSRPAKHFVGYGASRGRPQLGAGPHSRRASCARSTCTRSRRRCATPGCASVMNGYHELDGVPCAANRWLLTELLRDEWGFDGYVVADYFAVRQLEDYHHIAADAPEAAVAGAHGRARRRAADAPTATATSLLDGGRARAASHADVSTTPSTSVLRTKFELGLFERPFVDDRRVRAATAIGTAGQLDLAARARQPTAWCCCATTARCRSTPSAASIAVIGPNADDARNLLGDYSYAAHVESLLEMRDVGQRLQRPDAGRSRPRRDRRRPRIAPCSARSSAAFPDVDVRLRRGLRRHRHPIDRASPQPSRLAAESDVAVDGDGRQGRAHRRLTSGESRDRSSLDLPGVQEELVAAVAATGTPVVLVLVAGRPARQRRPPTRRRPPCSMPGCPATQGAAAIADVLIGRPTRAASSRSRSRAAPGHIPVYYRHKRLRRPFALEGRLRRRVRIAPLYPFGHGLSYTTFAHRRRARRARGRRRRRGTSRSAVDVTNTGEPRRRRGRAALRPRPAGIDHPPGARAEGVRPGARARRATSAA